VARAYWKGDVVKGTHPFYLSPEWRAMRARIKARDGYVCVWCGADVRGKGKARVDHIVPMEFMWALRLDPANLRTLCTRCDNKRHAEKGRGVADLGAHTDGTPRDPAHWWNQQPKRTKQ